MADIENQLLSHVDVEEIVKTFIKAQTIWLCTSIQHSLLEISYFFCALHGPIIYFDFNMGGKWAIIWSQIIIFFFHGRAS